MQVALAYGLKELGLDLPEARMLRAHGDALVPPLADPVAAVREALEVPLDFPALRQAFTPDDRVAVVVDDHLTFLPDLLVPILDHVHSAGVPLSAITLLTPPGADTSWSNLLSEPYRGMQLEVHDPAHRQRLSYLATTKAGRRIYLNRTVVDADQAVVLSRRDYDPILGYSGCEGSLYPLLSDAAALQEAAGQITTAAPGGEPWKAQREATEVAWLLGAPFMVQVIAGAGDELAGIIAGPASTGPEGQRRLDARWRVRVDQPADTVLAALGGNPARHSFSDLAHAASAAARVVKSQGRIILLSDSEPVLGPGAALLQQTEDPDRALSLLRQQTPSDHAAAFLWASAAQQARIYLLCNLPADIIEELFAVPLEQPEQVQRLLKGEGSILVLPDAHKTLAVVDT
jgi:nickel-dependent lactate racemase